MEKLDIQKLKAVELDLLKIFISVCEKHGLLYFLVEGSALGAVRHGGFIPWDDDIDVGMPREDYEKFLAVAQADLPEGIFLQTRITDPDYMTPFAKLRNSSTAFIESSAKKLAINHGIYIDIFPLDGCIDYDAYYKRAKMLKIRASSRFSVKRSLKLKLLHILAAIRYPNAKTALSRLEALWETVPYSTSKTVTSYGSAWGKKEVMPREIYGKGSMGTFEGIAVRLPERVDHYLTNLYGDYMTPPPPEKRVAHHACEVIDPERSYKEYV